MEYVFVTMSHDYADEFDVECCFVDKKDSFEKQMKDVQEAFDHGFLANEEFYFGTNEYLQFDSWEEFERGVDVKPCTEAFYNEFNDMTAYGAVGHCVLDSLIDAARNHKGE